MWSNSPQEPTKVAAGDLNDRSGRFDIASGDFDGDATDELAVVSTSNAVVAEGRENWWLQVQFAHPIAEPPFSRFDTIPQ